MEEVLQLLAPIHLLDDPGYLRKNLRGHFAFNMRETFDPFVILGVTFLTEVIQALKEVLDRQDPLPASARCQIHRREHVRIIPVELDYRLWIDRDVILEI